MFRFLTKTMDLWKNANLGALKSIFLKSKKTSFCFSGTSTNCSCWPFRSKTEDWEICIFWQKPWEKCKFWAFVKCFFFSPRRLVFLDFHQTLFLYNLFFKRKEWKISFFDKNLRLTHLEKLTFFCPL